MSGIWAVLYLLAISVILAGGIGGGGTPSRMISGVACVGSPLTGRALIKDASTPSREKAVVIGNNGVFFFDVSGMKGPYILEARGSAGGTNYTLHSFTDKSGIANITPLSDVAVAAAAGGDDPEQIYAHPEPVTLQRIKLNLPVAVATLQSKLKPLFDLYGVDNADPIRERFRINDAGFDALLDDMKFVLSNGDLTIVDGVTGAHIFTSKVAYINVGKFINLPAHRLSPIPNSAKSLRANQSGNDPTV